jgi:hypothetical protein
MKNENKKNFFGQDGMKPMLILPPNAVSAADIEKLNDNGICTVVAKNPRALKFVDPIPSIMQRTKIEDTAIKFSRKILNRGTGYFPYDSYERASKSDLCVLFVNLLVDGTPLDPDGTIEEQQQAVFDEAKRDELRRLAREEARAERVAKKKEATGLKKSLTPVLPTA